MEIDHNRLFLVPVVVEILLKNRNFLKAVLQTIGDCFASSKKRAAKNDVLENSLSLLCLSYVFILQTLKAAVVQL